MSVHLLNARAAICPALGHLTARAAICPALSHLNARAAVCPALSRLAVSWLVWGGSGHHGLWLFDW